MLEWVNITARLAHTASWDCHQNVVEQLGKRKSVCVGVIWGEGCFLSVLTYLNIFKIQVTDNSCILHGLHVIFKLYLKS